MIETSGVIEKEQGNGFYLVTLEQPAGHQCLVQSGWKAHQVSNQIARR